MIHRLLPPGLACLLLLGSAPTARAQADPFKADSPAASNQVQLKAAIKAANDGRFDDSVGLIDQVLKQSPDDRDGLFLMTFIAGMAADKTKDNAGKIAQLRRSDAAYARLARRYHPLDRDELKLGETAKLNGGRIALLEGKPEEALDRLAKVVAEGYAKPALIDLAPDFEAVRKLPDYGSKMLQANTVAVGPLLSKFRSYPFDFALKNVDGKVVKLADVQGKVTVVDIWGTWCPPCREEIPHLVDLANRLAPQGLKVVGINCNEEGGPAEVRKTINDFIAANKITYPCVVNDETVESKVPDFEGYPTTLFLDRTGAVRLKLMGYQPLARLEAIVAALLAEPAR